METFGYQPQVCLEKWPLKYREIDFMDVILCLMWLQSFTPDNNVLL